MLFTKKFRINNLVDFGVTIYYNIKNSESLCYFMYAINTNEGYFLHLIKCALKDEQPQEKPDEVSWQEVLVIAERQDAANLCWFSIEKLNNQPQGELALYWQEVYAKAASKCLKQMMEIDYLADEFTKCGYDIMFLKGSKIREYYPSPDMRTMTDIDLLVKAKDRKPIRELMKSLGYEVDLLDDGQVDAFKKLPVIYVEVHYDFSAENHVYHDIFTIDWNNLVSTDREHIYEMTFEDLYFFNIGHYAKNMHNRGMGIRAILDSYVLWNNASEEQKQLVLKIFKDTELEEFNNNLLKIVDIWFNGADDNGSLDNVQQYLLKTETYGSRKSEVMLRFIDNNNDAKAKSKVRFLINRLFPSADALYSRFNIKKRIFILLPFLWLLRIIILPFSKDVNKEGRRNEIKNLNSFSKADVEYEIEIRKQFGLIGD